MYSKIKNRTKIKIATQFSLLAVAVFVGFGVIYIIFNNVFLQKFYMKKKEDALKNAYYRITEASKDEKLTSVKFGEEIEQVCERYGLEIIIVDVDSQNVMYECADVEDMRLALWDRVFFDEDKEATFAVIEQDEKYQLLILQNPRNQLEYIQMWGFLSDENIFLMRTPLESIREVASITNRFILICLSTGMVLGVIVIFVITHRITKPILELADISQRMSGLDFEVKYEGDEQNEIGLLGKNFNLMSEKLESTISKLKSANLELMRDIEKKEALEQMRSDFIAGVSHELKTPIAIIQGYAEGLSEGISDDVQSRKYYCEVICDEASKMNEMVKKLLTLNELEFGGQNLDIERFDIVTLIKNKLSSLQMMMEQQGITLKCEIKNPIYVWGDEYRIEEVFTNYITNAMHHCEGIKQIVVDVAIYEKVVRISVFNTGAQIPADCMPYLFDKFYKVDKARSREYGGSGVGLSIVKAIQDLASMQYGVTNKDEGVEFWFDIDKG